MSNPGSCRFDIGCYAKSYDGLGVVKKIAPSNVGFAYDRVLIEDAAHSRSYELERWQLERASLLEVIA